MGPRDDDLRPKGIAARFYRAQWNFLETFPIFVAVIFMVHATKSEGVLSYWGCVLYLGGRSAFLPLYAIGIPWLRTISWNIATLGLVLVGAAVVAKSVLE